MYIDFIMNKMIGINEIQNKYLEDPVLWLIDSGVVNIFFYREMLYLLLAIIKFQLWDNYLLCLTNCRL